MGRRPRGPGSESDRPNGPAKGKVVEKSEDLQQSVLSWTLALYWSAGSVV